MEPLFSYDKVTDNDVEFYKAVPGTIKITGINGTAQGVVDIPETIDGLPVTYYAGLSYFGDPIRKLIVPKTLVALTSTEYFPEIADELVIAKDNPVWSTDGVSLLSKDGTRLLRMCQKNRASYTIPDGVTTNCCNAFKFNNNVEITIPDSVTTVEGGAFRYSALKKVLGGRSIVNFQSSSFDDTDWYKSSPVLVLGTTLLRHDTMEENVVVPDGIEVIGPKAFSSSGGKNSILETVKLPSTVREISEYAFSNKRNLKAINFPDGLQTIGKNAFYGCQSLTEIVLPDSIAEIGAEAFQGCSSVTKAVIPHAVSGTKTDNTFQKEVEAGLISAGAFSGCTSLERFDIPEGTAAIGASAFNNCRSLKSIRIPETVTAIRKEAFANCSELEELFLPANCIELGQSVFPHTTTGWGGRSARFRKIKVDPRNGAFSSINGILCSKNGDTLIACPSQYIEADYIIPEGVKEIGPGAFEGCEKIKRVVFAGTVDKIGARAFAFMPALEEIVLPPDFPALGDGLFEGCEKLKYITWPKNVREIGEKCFAHTGIEDLAIPDTVETIGKYAFSFIKAKRGRLPKTVKSLSLSVFAGVPEIEVYDTIDPDAKPAADYLDNMNGGLNGMVGFIGIHQKEGYMVAACNADWHEHTIIVRSASGDSEKYTVRMPNGQKRKVYCTFASSWGKNAEFNFSAVDNIFMDLTADAKLDYAFNRLHWQAGISEEMRSTLAKYAARNAKEIAARVFQTDGVDDLAMLESFGIVKKNTIDEQISEADKAQALQCKAWLLNWQNCNLSAKEKNARAEKSPGLGAPTVAEIKKIWPNKKGMDGGLTITGYNGKDVDVCVPEVIGKTPVTAIGDRCFSDNKDQEQAEFLRTQLRSVEIPDSVKEIGGWVFYECAGLESVKLPRGMKKIRSNLFFHCPKLSIEIPDGITEIQDMAFAGCSMKTMTIPASVKTISEKAFGICHGWGSREMESLEAIEVDPASGHFKSVDGVLFSFDGKTLMKYPQAKTAENYVIPDGVVRIAGNAFSSVGALKAIVIPESVDVVDDAAFSKCGSLESVSMPKRLSGLGSAFDECASLREIAVPSGVTELPDRCFMGCGDLVKASLPKGLKKIGYEAFKGCGSLAEVNIPASVRGIGTYAFEGCRSLKDITISKSTTGIGVGVFRDCADLTIHTPERSKMYEFAKTEKIKVEALIEAAEEEVPADKKPAEKHASPREKAPSCWKLRDGWLESYAGNDPEVVIPAKIGSKAVKGLGGSLFAGNKTLKKVVISEGIECIYDNAFRGCSALTDIVFPQSLNEVGNNYSVNGYPAGDTPFYGTPWEKQQGQMIIAGNVLVRYKGSDESVSIPEGIRVIGELAFAKNKTIKSVKLPDSAEVIRRAAFEGCGRLEELLLPVGITTIETGAFSGCKGIKEMVLPESLKIFGDDHGGPVLDGCTGMKKLVIKGDRSCVSPGQFFDSHVELIFEQPQTDPGTENLKRQIGAAEPGDIVSLGHSPEPIEWIVLKKEADRALLLAKDCVETATYHSQKKPVTWEKSRIRIWLNGPFYSMAFSDEEKAQILPTANQTQANAKSGAAGGKDTTDRLFLLSEQEVKQLVPKENRVCKCSLIYARENCWWTRTPSTDGTQGALVRGNGTIVQDPSAVRGFYAWSPAGIRPACWVKL